MEMVVKKGNTSDTKVKNGTAKTNRARGNESGSLVDKNGNMLPAENRSKREEKCQVKRQGLKGTINTETNTKDSKVLTPSGELITSHESSDGTIYEVDDCVYIDSQRPDVPFFICAIKEFRMCKRECLYVGVKWFYRPSEVPESVYQLLVQDRNTENGSRDHILEDSSVKERELFVSDAVDNYSVSALRGKCKVKCLSEVPGLKEFISHNDNFFYVLRYNPETRRLANHKGEIRVGPSHQVLLPECKPKDQAINELNSSLKEELSWRPTLDDYDLMMFVGAARSMAQYAGICKEGDTTKGLTVAARDATTINALNVLHESKYDTAQALQSLVKRPFPKTPRMNWTDDEMKRFVKGLRQFGKNFYKIKKELLPQKETCDLVEYYYTWKKTPSALSSRPHRRRRHNVLRRRNLTRAAKASSSEFLELSSCSEDEYDSEDSEKDFNLYCCRHCYSSNSKSWHHGGYDRLILCTECLTYFKKYGIMRKIEEVREPPPYMFKVVMEKENDEDYYVNGKQLRSRRSTPNISSSLRYGRSKACSPLDAVIARESQINGRKLTTRLTKPDSPSGASTGSNTSSSSSNKKIQPAKRRRTKKTSEPSPENILPPKRKKSITRESDEDETDQSERNSSPAMDQESVAVEGDVISISSRASTNEEGRTSPSPESMELPEHECEAGKFPARKVLDGETSARTELPFTPNKRPVARTEENKETVERKSKEKKHENEECSTQRSQKPENRTPSETVTASANLTSHQEHLHKYMAAAAAYSRFNHGYPGMPVHGAPMMPMSLQPPADASLLQWHLHPGLKDLRDAKDFENWYAPYKVPRLRTNMTHSLPSSLLHSASLMDGQRNSPLHRHKDGIILPGGGIPLGTDPVTGLPQHHSHSHVHTHYHLHPGEQHLNQPRSPSLNLEPNWLLRNNHVTPGHEMWLHPQVMSGHGRHLMGPGEELNGISPYFPGLYPPREYQLQHELMSQGLKIDHGYTFYHPFLSASREHSMRYVRPHDRQPRLGIIDEPSASLLHRADVRSMRSPSLKNFESGSNMLLTNQKPSTIHPILVDDD